MKSTKIAEEMSRLINDVSRKYRSMQKPPNAQSLTALAKLALSYSKITVAEAPNKKQHHDPSRGQYLGYEKMVAMHEKIAMKKLISENRDPEDKDDDCEN
jgi:hypothetical protein